MGDKSTIPYVSQKDKKKLEFSSGSPCFFPSKNSSFRSNVVKEVKRNRLFVIKRNGEKQEVLYDKITNRIEVLIKVNPQLSDYIDPVRNIFKKKFLLSFSR